MKKILYSLMMSVIALTSCTTWDDPVTENYGDGPSISIDLQAVAPTDSAFNVTLTPAAGATYYAYVISEGEEANVDASTLLKGGYGNKVVNTSTSPTLTFPVSDGIPNTDYYVYAVACSDKGIVGPLAVKSIKTSDAGAPYPVDADTDPDKKTFTVEFSEAITPGDGKIIVAYYREWDITNPVTVPEEELVITTADNVLTVEAPTTPAGAFLTLSWEAGAFTDNFGNKCSAFNSGLNMNTGRWSGVYFRNTIVPFEVNDTNIVSPEDQALITEFEDFEGKIEMPFEIFRNDEEVEDGAVRVIYINEKKTTFYHLTPEQWSVSGKTLTFTLPVKPEAGDIIKVGLGEEAIFDVYGNPNKEFTADEVNWLFFAPTLDMILGTFNIKYISYWSEDNTVEDFGNITITEDPETENGLIISNLIIDGSAIKATYDLASGKIIIPDEQYLGIFTASSGAKYIMLFVTADGADAATLTINPNGTLSGDGMWGIYLLDESYGDVGWYEIAKVSQFSPVTAAKAARKAVVGKKTFKKVKVSKAARSLKKRFRK